VSHFQDTADVAFERSFTPVRETEARKALLGYAMDGFDLLILGFMLRVISADLGFGPAQAASLVTATLIGALIGFGDKRHETCALGDRPLEEGRRHPWKNCSIG
jgi:MFS family permease